MTNNSQRLFSRSRVPGKPASRQYRVYESVLRCLALKVRVSARGLRLHRQEEGDLAPNHVWRDRDRHEPDQVAAAGAQPEPDEASVRCLDRAHVVPEYGGPGRRQREHDGAHYVRLAHLSTSMRLPRMNWTHGTAMLFPRAL